MELSIRELNELIYCIGIARMHGQLLGTTVADNLEVALRDELDKRLEMDLSTKSHYVSNEEADEDFLSTLEQDEQRYEDSHMLTSFPITDPFTSVVYKKRERGWITQAMLDYVDNTGASTYKEMNEFYQFITGGSNSFSHILESLRTPYKNRKTQRYLAKEGKRGSNAKWVVKVANPSNWVVVND
jgi:cob(I)alamin adenosyltransferase